ncbi:MAG: hypothetical protein AAGF12_11650 [Myxococcota bacterium]
MIRPLALTLWLSALSGCGTSVTLGDPIVGDAANEDAALPDGRVPDARVPTTRPTAPVSVEPAVPASLRLEAATAAQLDDTLLVAFKDWGRIYLQRIGTDGEPLDEWPTLISGTLDGAYNGPWVVSLEDRFAVFWTTERHILRYSLVGLDGTFTFSSSLMPECLRFESLIVRTLPAVSIASEGNRIAIGAIRNRENEPVSRTTPTLCVAEYKLSESADLSLVREAQQDLYTIATRDFSELASVSVALRNGRVAVLYPNQGTPGLPFGRLIERWLPFEPAVPREMVAPLGQFQAALSNVAVGPSDAFIAWGEWDGASPSGRPRNGALRGIALDLETWLPRSGGPLDIGDTERRWQNHATDIWQKPVAVADESGFLVLPPANGTSSRTSVSAARVDPSIHRVQGATVSDSALPPEAHHGAYFALPRGDGRTTVGLAVQNPNSIYTAGLRLADWLDPNGWSLADRAPAATLEGVDAPFVDAAWLDCNGVQCVAVFAREDGIFATVLRTEDGTIEGPTAFTLREWATAGVNNEASSRHRGICVANDQQRFLVAWHEWVSIGAEREYRVIGRWFDGSSWSPAELFYATRLTGSSALASPVACTFTEEAGFVVGYELETTFTVVGGFEAPFDEIDSVALGTEPGVPPLIYATALRDGALFGVQNGSTFTLSGGTLNEQMHSDVVPVGVSRWFQGGAAMLATGRDEETQLTARVLDSEGDATGRVYVIDPGLAWPYRPRMASTPSGVLVAYEKLIGPGVETPQSWFVHVGAEGTVDRERFVDRVQDVRVLPDGYRAVLYRVSDPATVPAVSELRFRIFGPPFLDLP